MKIVVILFVMLAGAVSSVFAADRRPPPIASHPSKISYKKLDWKVPLGSPFRVTLKNGLRAYVATDSQLPLVQISALFRCGSLYDPAGKEGLCALMARAMRTGGTRQYHPDTLDALLDLYALRFSVSASEDILHFSASFLSDYLDTAFAVMRQMLVHPRFDSVKLGKEKKIFVEAIRHRFDNPGPALDIAYQKLLYAGTTAGRLATEKSVGSISRGDCASLHRRAVSAGGCILAVTGPFERTAIIDRLEVLFPAGKATGDTAFPDIAVKPLLKCLVIHKPISQVYVKFGVPLFKRPHADYYAASVANLILGGGGFTSRLGTRVRSDAGLTYSIHSSAESNYTYPASWHVEFFTKSESFPEAMSLALRVIDSFCATGPDRKELANAKTSLVDEMPSMFRSPFDIVSTYAWNEYFGRSPEHYRRYPDSIMAITGDAARDAVSKYLDPSSCIYTVIGDTAALSRHDAAGDFSLEKLTPRRTITADSIAALP
ncbi:MAG: insulinase family protein [Chitinispirillaceae bacterium]|nr:insulinase family protein [Chitinispirillaceae bacterium]